MKNTPLFLSIRFVTLLVLVAFAAAPVAYSQITPEQAKMAGAVPLSTVLLDKLDKLVKAIGSDSAVKAEFATSGKDDGIKPDFSNIGEIVDSKYPKLSAAFKSSDLTPFEFMNADMALTMSAAIAEMRTGAGSKSADDDKLLGIPALDERSEANVTFYKANKDRATATLTAISALDK